MTRGEKERIVYEWAKNQSAQSLASLLVNSAMTRTLEEIIRSNNLKKS
jgi:hypothetical protein